MQIPKRRFLPVSVLFSAALASSAWSAPKSDLVELSTRIQRYSIDYTVNADGTDTVVYEKAIKILKQKAVEPLKRASVSYSTSAERGEILAAYTLKPDGRRIEVPRNNYQLEINKGRESDAPAFSDNTELSVIFPDVAVDDVVVLKYSIKTVDPMFPGNFSVAERFNRSGAYDAVTVRIDSPAGVWAQYAATDLTKTRDDVAGDRRIVEWTWKNPEPVKSKRRDYSAFQFDKEPGFAFSTFRGYGDIAEAYGRRARPKAAVTERVRTLADDLTKGVSDAREQARILYEWVATNIDYAGNCVGVGAVVPRDQAFVLDNKMGDCKDHATLLQALLAAKGIVSTQALVNAGSSYHLPRIPVISMVNHVIVYVPSMDLFLDSTSSSTPFGMLPMGDSDKPVLLVDGYKEGLRTPPTRSEQNRQVAKTEVTIRPDGSVAGSVSVVSSGSFAVEGRDRLRNVTQQERDELLERIYKGEHKTGFGRLQSEDPKPLRDSFKYDVQFEAEEFIRRPGPGAFAVEPLYATEASVNMIGSLTEEEPEADETACFGGSITEEYVYHLPKGLKVLAMPKAVTVNGGVATYKSSYELKGSTLTVKREIVDRTVGNVCPIQVQHDYAVFARKVAADLKSQIVYQ
ncbi:MAG TPA: DUF3857 and transglutaminase domain-containing protein [Usitatibacter sp.]|nr:DUF3857 and transglutaminase domain-containing protein [Usitatibacter sp.]